MKELGNIVAFTCLIMQNMCPTDKVMSGDTNALVQSYRSLEEDITEAGSTQIPSDMEDILEKVCDDDSAETSAVVDVKSMVNATRRKVWNNLIDVDKWKRLQLSAGIHHINI